MALPSHLHIEVSQGLLRNCRILRKIKELLLNQTVNRKATLNILIDLIVDLMNPYEPQQHIQYHTIIFHTHSTKIKLQSVFDKRNCRQVGTPKQHHANIIHAKLQGHVSDPQSQCMDGIVVMRLRQLRVLLTHPSHYWSGQVFSLSLIVIITFQVLTFLHHFDHFPCLRHTGFGPWEALGVTQLGALQATFIVTRRFNMWDVRKLEWKNVGTRSTQVHMTTIDSQWHLAFVSLPPKQRDHMT